MQMEHITINVDGKLVRREQLDGRMHLVAPLVMMTEGVHEGSRGPVLYRKQELIKWCPSWNHKPITINHPEKNGDPQSGSDPEVLNTLRVGVVLNTRYDDKQRAEGWFDEDLLKQRGPAVLKALNKKKMMELSTGLFVDVEGGAGVFNGKKHIGEAKNHRPDHLAILPDKIGACSIADGAGLLQLNETTLKVVLNKDESLKEGLLRLVMKSAAVQEAITNELSHSAIHSALREELSSDSEPISVFIEDVFDKYFVYWKDGELNKQPYKATNSGVSFEGEPAVVERLVKYQPVSNSGQTQEKDIMAKKELVDGLIANTATQFEEKDREWLMTMNDDQLGKLAPKAAAKVEPTPTPTPTPAPVAGNPAPVVTPAPVANTGVKPQTVQEYIANAPAELQHILNNGVAVFNQEREKHITTILANPNNALPKEVLEKLDINVLFNLAKLAEGTTKKDSGNLPAPNYLGLGPVQNQGAGGGKEHKEEPMPVPTLNFEKKAVA